MGDGRRMVMDTSQGRGTMGFRLDIKKGVDGNTPE
jgi:hypothetical protein